MDENLLGLIVTVAIALIGFAVKYANDLAIARRKDQLERVNQQLRLLYGPLYAADQAGRIAWEGFRSVYRPGVGYWDSEPSDSEKEAWRLWMTEVFMPLNLRIEKTIIENADLLEEERMPECFMEMCAHVAAYKAVLKRWSVGDYSQNTSLLNYPWQEFRAYVTGSYRTLKARQAKLLNQLQRRRIVRRKAQRNSG